MKYVQEYRNKELAALLLKQIHAWKGPKVRFMEVCGGHTMVIQKYGIPGLLPSNVSLISGPGCPVCVTSLQYIDHAVALSRLENVILTTYGDLIRVPGSTSSLEREKARGADIRMVYSTLEALAVAKNNPDKKVVFLGIGFETTAPASAVALIRAREYNLRNFLLLSAHKMMPPAMEAIVDAEVKIDGYLAPGHVSTITGSNIFHDIPQKYKLPVVVSGFEPLDILQSIYMLLKQIETNDFKVEIQYKRAVKPQGNLKARSMLKEVFIERNDWWRGLGVLPDSGLGINDAYADWDAERSLHVVIETTKEPGGCICGEILKGLKKPSECPLYKKTCTPVNPIGTCMVSEEGACQAYYKYGAA
ncbi:MAG: hydrogenase formation protein HypD [Balneolales bacterium]